MVKYTLTFPQYISKSCIKMKIKFLFLYFFVVPLCGAWKGFMKAFKVFLKSFEALQRSLKVEI